MLDSQRLEERLDRKLIVRLTRDRLTHERRVRQGVSRVSARRSGIKRRPCGPWIAGVSQDIRPVAVVRGAGRFRTNARRMIEQLLNRDRRFPRIAQRPSPRDIIKSMIIERHFTRSLSLAALFRCNG